MNRRSIVVALFAALALASCAKKQTIAEAPPPPVSAPAPLPASWPGAIPGSVAADRDGDGIVDGYYTPDGIYRPGVAPPPPSSPILARRGERG